MAFVKSVFLICISVFIVLILFAVLIRLLEDFMTFHPRRELEYRPENYGLSAADIWINSGIKDKIHGWYFEPFQKSAPVLLVFHGNAGNISHRLEWLAPFVRQGLGAFLFDYRGYGLSSGKPGEKAFQQDALAVWQYLTEEKAIPAKQLAVFGRSLGGAPATFLAAERETGWLLLEGCFSSGKDFAHRIFGFFPAHLAMKNHWEVSRCLKKVTVPVMIIHGRQDEVVPFALGEKLAKEGNTGNLEFWVVDEGRHMGLYLTQGEAYYQRIEKFLETRRDTR